MPGLGMQHAVEQMPANVHTRANAGAHRDVDHVVEALARTVYDLAQACTVHVGVVAAGYVEPTGHFAKEVIAAPSDLGRLQDVTVVGRFGIDRRGTKGSDTKGGDPLIGEPLDHGGNRLRWLFRGNARTFHDRSIGIAGRQHHLGATRLDRTDQLLVHNALPRVGFIRHPSIKLQYPSIWSTEVIGTSFEEQALN